MSNTFQCPACGGLIEYTSSNQAMNCPFCGTAVTTPEQAEETSAPAQTDQAEMIDAAAQTLLQQHSSRFQNSAEVMDEVKRLLREGDKTQAVAVYRKEFNVTLKDARSSVEQIEIDMKHSGRETPPPPESVPSPIPSTPVQNVDVIDAPPAPQKSSFPTKAVVIGCVMALVLCCICVIGPVIVWVLIRR